MRELTVVLKGETNPPKPFSNQAISFVNEFVKSPIFIFIFGTSVGTAFPVIKDWLTPAGQLELRRAQEQARADAALIAPFIANLDVNKPGQFEAARAALSALEASASAADAGKKRPVYAAVNKAIEAVGIQLRPKAQSTADPSQKIEVTSQVTSTSPQSQDLGLLAKDTLVYIQVSRDDSKSQDFAENALKALRNASVLAAGIEKLSASIMPRETQVRYFTEADKSKAEVLAGLVSNVTKGDVRVAKLRLEAKPGTLEVWFGNVRLAK